MEELIESDASTRVKIMAIAVVTAYLLGMGIERGAVGRALSVGMLQQGEIQ
jgi:hypothetical protein